MCRFGPFAEPKANNRLLRTPAIAGPSSEGKNPPLRDIPDHKVTVGPANAV
jgi:hypothetical protein